MSRCLCQADSYAPTNRHSLFFPNCVYLHRVFDLANYSGGASKTPLIHHAGHLGGHPTIFREAEATTTDLS